MPKPDHEREYPVEPSVAKIPEHLAGGWRHGHGTVVIFGGHLLQLLAQLPSSTLFFTPLNIARARVRIDFRKWVPSIRPRCNQTQSMQEANG
jgi:hypothetical protein